MARPSQRLLWHITDILFGPIPQPAAEIIGGLLQTELLRDRIPDTKLTQYTGG